jgi:outer membrane protein OmpA-like peptidoglycan-associated protein
MSGGNKSRGVTGMLIALALMLISSGALAQSGSNGHWDLLIGYRYQYQWLHPGAFPAPPPARAATCSVVPNEVIVGDPVTATVKVGNFNPKHTLTYVWHPSSGGGKIIGTDAVTRIETTDAAPGSYTVTAFVTDAKDKDKKNNEARCSADFIIKPPPLRIPPTLSLSASQTSVPAGGTVNLSANCTSPGGDPVSVTGWTASGGTISGAGEAATLSTGGVSPGSIRVSATCTDSRGVTSQASTEMVVENLPPPPPTPEIEARETRLALNSIYFPTTLPQIGNLQAGLVASQRQTLVALAIDFKKYLESKPEAHLILEGHADPMGEAEYNQDLSVRRVEIVKSFLVEQGISEGSIDTKGFGASHSLSEAEVKEAVENNPQISPEERQSALRGMRKIVLASDRRVDITLSTTGQSSVRQLPLNAADAATLIGRRRGKAEPKKGTN